VPLNKIEDFGAHQNQYYQLEISCEPSSDAARLWRPPSHLQALPLRPAEQALSERPAPMPVDGRFQVRE
jgi:hypothetical protein